MSAAVSKDSPSAARVGIGGPVGSGKTALLEQLIPRFKARGTEMAVVTNDLVTKEDAERLRRSGLIDPERVMAVEAGACPHTVIREDPTLNIETADLLEETFDSLDLIIIESGGDNLRRRSRSISSITGRLSSTWPVATTYPASAARAWCRATFW